MLGLLALMAVTLAGADQVLCARYMEEAAVDRMIAAAEADLYAAEAYADALSDFHVVLDEVGLAGSTLGREEVRAAASHTGASAVARNR